MLRAKGDPAAAKVILKLGKDNSRVKFSGNLVLDSPSDNIRAFVDAKASSK